MIEQQITLCSNGRAVLSGYSGGLLLGYAHNTGVYRLRVVCSGEWDGTTVAAFWHLPGPAEPLTTLVADGAVEVPALVTAQGGSGTVTFEGSDGTRTVTSASVPYRVLSNSGTTDHALPEPGSPAWQQFLQQVKRELRTAASGLSDEERGLILALFRHAVYDNGEMLPHYNALAAIWSGSSLPDVPPTPSQPGTPDTPSDTLPTPLYKLAAQKTFVQSQKECIDTGLKLFETVNDAMELTLLATFSVAAGTYTGSSPAALFDCFINNSGDQRGVFGCTWGDGNFGVNVYQSSGASNTLVDDTKLQLAIQIKGGKYRMTQNGTFGAWSSISNYGTGKTVSKSLIIGASLGDGTEKKFYFGGTVYDFQVYGKALTDAQVKTLLAEGLSGTTVTPSTPATVPGETAVYELTTPTDFKIAEEKYIDTGVKLFEDISAQPTWTILLDSTDFSRLKNLSTSPVMFHCGAKGADGFMSVMAWLNGAVVFDLYGAQTQFGWWGGSTSAYLRMCLQIRGNQYKLSYDSKQTPMSEGSWTDIPNYSKNIDATLLLGAYRNDDGTIGRFWEGNLNKFAVYNKLLTDEQIKTFMEAK